MSDKIIIISGTNRVGSNTARIAKLYKDLVEKQQKNALIVSLEEIDVTKRTEQYKEIEEKFLIEAEKFIFICPEYNGSIPGILKSMIDISDYKKVWWGKKALLVGVSTGRSGNVRGMEHLTSILNYLKVIVHPNKLPISSVDKLMDDSGIINDMETLNVIRLQLEEFLKF